MYSTVEKVKVSIIYILSTVEEVKINYNNYDYFIGAKLKSIFVKMPTEVVHMCLMPTESRSTVKELISTFSGIQFSNLRLFHQNKPICDTISINTIPNDANIVDQYWVA